jgi:hypothetical protein
MRYAPAYPPAGFTYAPRPPAGFNTLRVDIPKEDFTPCRQVRKRRLHTLLVAVLYFDVWFTFSVLGAFFALQKTGLCGGSAA